MTCYRFVLLAILLSLSSAAGAQIVPTPHNLRVVPSPAVAGQPMAARLRQVCSEGNLDTPAVTVLGTVVTLSQSFEPLICIGLPPPLGDVDIPLGAFAQGSYTLTYVLRDRSSNTSTQESTQFLVIAGVGPPRNLRVVPNPAIAGQPVNARLLLSCDEGQFRPATVAVNGTAVTLTQVQGPSCNIGVPPPPADVEFPLGAFPQGTYTLTYLYRASSGNVLYAESTQFGVGAAAGVPAVSAQLLILLALALGALGLRRLGEHAG